MKTLDVLQEVLGSKRTSRMAIRTGEAVMAPFISFQIMVNIGLKNYILESNGWVSYRLIFIGGC